MKIPLDKIVNVNPVTVGPGHLDLLSPEAYNKFQEFVAMMKGDGNGSFGDVLVETFPSYEASEYGEVGLLTWGILLGAFLVKNPKPRADEPKK